MSQRTRADILAEAEKNRTKGLPAGNRIQIAARLDPLVFYEVSMLAELRGISMSKLVKGFIEIQIAMEEELREDEAARILWGER